MIRLTNVCPHCGEDWWEHHECEGTRREAAEQEALAKAINEKLIEDKLAWAEYESARMKKEQSVLHSNHDPVHAPKHYTSHPSGVECIDVTKHYNFQIGNAMKYLWRQGLKDEVGLDSVEKQIQDCEKAVWYITSFINDLKGIK